MRVFMIFGRGLYIFELLSQVAFDGGGQLEEVFLDKILAEARPSGEKSILDGFEPTRGGWAIATFVEIGDEVGFGFHFVDAVGCMTKNSCVAGWRWWLLLEIDCPKFCGWLPRSSN